MNIQIRRVIAFSFIVAFLIAAPLLILYTAGYRYSWKKQKISQTGTLILVTKPKSGEITLNNYRIAEKTPVRLTNLFPNEYLIKIEKSGYYPWEKKLPVYSQQTTFAENIILFKQSTEKKLSELAIASPKLDTDKKWLYFFTPNTDKILLRRVNLRNQQLETLKEIDNARLLDFQLSPQNNYLYLEYATSDQPSKKNIMIFQPDQPEKTADLQPWSQNSAINFNWSADNDDHAYFIAQQTLSRLNLATSFTQAEKIKDFSNDVMDFYVTEKNLYYIEKISDQLYLTYAPLETLVSQTKIELPKATYDIAEMLDEKLVIKNLDRDQLLIFNKDLSNIILAPTSATNYQYRAKDGRLLLYSDTDIAIVNLNDNSTSIETITRMSDGFTQVDWYTDPNYLFYVNNKTLNLLELDNRDLRNLVTLNPAGVSHAWLDYKGEKIFFTKISEPGLFEIEIIN